MEFGVAAVVDGQAVEAVAVGYDLSEGCGVATIVDGQAFEDVAEGYDLLQTPYCRKPKKFQNRRKKTRFSSFCDQIQYLVEFVWNLA